MLIIKSRIYEDKIFNFSSSLSFFFSPKKDKNISFLWSIIIEKMLSKVSKYHVPFAGSYYLLPDVSDLLKFFTVDPEPVTFQRICDGVKRKTNIQKISEDHENYISKNSHGLSFMGADEKYTMFWTTKKEKEINLSGIQPCIIRNIKSDNDVILISNGTYSIIPKNCSPLIFLNSYTGIHLSSETEITCDVLYFYSTIFSSVLYWVFKYGKTFCIHRLNSDTYCVQYEFYSEIKCNRGRDRIILE